MPITIITDSASDIEQGELHNVRVLPMTVTIDGVPYSDGIDITKDEFYRLQKGSDTIPVSSLISPFQFQEAFDEVESAGEEAIVITISSELSGTCQSAKAVAEGRDGISVIDSLQVSGAQKLLVLRALQLTLLGLSRDEIVRELEEEKHRIVIFAAVDTMEYLVKGGRVSRTSGFIGNMVGIKPGGQYRWETIDKRVPSYSAAWTRGAQGPSRGRPRPTSSWRAGTPPLPRSCSPRREWRGGSRRPRKRGR